MELAINFGLEILKIIPGWVSTEVDATYSFDTEGDGRQGPAGFLGLASRPASATYPDQGRQHLGRHPCAAEQLER